MKKVLVILAAMCLASALSFARATEDQEFIIKFGLQPEGNWLDSAGDESTMPGVSSGVEYFKYFNNIVAIGGGINYDMPRNFKAADIVPGTISFLPIYTSVKVRMPLHGLENNYPFIAAKLGYSAFMDNADWIAASSGGLYTGISAGYCIGSLFFEASYSINNLSYRLDNSSKSFDVTYSTIAVYIGIKME